MACAGLLVGLPDAASPVEPLGTLDDKSQWRFVKTVGQGEASVETTPQGPAWRFWASGETGMAGFIESPRVRVDPGYHYVVRAEIRTQALEALTAQLLGMPYVRYWDAQAYPGSHQPMAGVVAPRDSDWHEIALPVITPTTARQATIYYAFGAYGGYEGGRIPRESGRAKGELWVRNIRFEKGNAAPAPLPSTMRTSDTAIQQGADTIAECLHNAALGGEFTVSDGYTLSGNIVPDLSFGLFGVRRLAHPAYMEMFRRYWTKIAQHFGKDGRSVDIRVMAHLFFPLGLDEIFSFTGDWEYLEQYLPVADASFDFVVGHEDEFGLARLVEYGKWRLGEGADWVDWYPTRMEGKTFNFHQWYVRALRRTAMLHRNLAKRRPAASAECLKRAASYEAKAAQVEASLRQLYWRDDHFVTNIDFGGKVVDQKWLDDQVWSIRLGVADAAMTRQIWQWIDRAPEYFESVPTRWTAFDGPQHGMDTWFGRLGAGDILARYASGNPKRGYELLKRISDVFNRLHNVYEAYDMKGEVVRGTSGWGNYTEHSGGYMWALSEGPFGLFCDDDQEALATIVPRLPSHWTEASIEFVVRGTRLRASFSSSKGGRKMVVASSGAPIPLRLRAAGGRTQIVKIRDGRSESFSLQA